MILFLEKIFMCEDKGMGESTSFVSGSSCHFPGKCRKLENNFLNACQSHFFLLFIAVINVNMLKIKADLSKTKKGSIVPPYLYEEIVFDISKMWDAVPQIDMEPLLRDSEMQRPS